MAFIIQSNREINKEDILDIRQRVYDHEDTCIKNYDVAALQFDTICYNNYVIKYKGFEPMTSCWWVEVIDPAAKNQNVRFAYEVNNYLGIDIGKSDPLVRPILNPDRYWQWLTSDIDDIWSYSSGDETWLSGNAREEEIINMPDDVVLEPWFVIVQREIDKEREKFRQEDFGDTVL